MRLYFFGHKIVSQSMYPRVESVADLADLKQQMIAMMNRHKFPGLSAPQVGILLQYALVRLEDGSILELANPIITRMYGLEIEAQEGCISCPPYNNTCKVSRMQIIHVTHGAESVSVDQRFTGKDSRIIQHEIDHLRGGWFFNRANGRERDVVLQRFGEWMKNWKFKQKEKEMATVFPPRPKKSVPDNSPLEAGTIACSACGSLLLPEVLAGPRSIEGIKYTCKNEVTGCNYTVVRKVPVSNTEMKGVRPDGTVAKL